MDNTGPYCSLAQLLTTFWKAGKASADKVLISAKAVTVSPAGTFSVAAPTLVPTVLDWIVQGDVAQQVTSVVGLVVGLEDVSLLANGEARLIRSDFMASELSAFRSEAMAFIDRHTRQWFNARPATVKLLGNNSPLMQFPVPIISTEYLRLNGDTSNLDVKQFLAPTSRTMPDDRRNPRILLVRQDYDIFRMEPRCFLTDRQSEWKGVLGFLEEDGSTPLMIQRATLKLAVMRAINNAGTSGATSASISGSGVGALKREKTDIHEKEYFNPDAGGSGRNSTASGTGLSGDDEIDDTIAAYRSPILIGGSIIDVIYPRESLVRW